MFLKESNRLLVIGSLNANPADRVLNRDTIRSVQLINNKEEKIENYDKVD